MVNKAFPLLSLKCPHAQPTSGLQEWQWPPTARAKDVEALNAPLSCIVWYSSPVHLLATRMWAPSGLFLSAATTQSIVHSLCPQDYCLSSLTPCSVLHTAPNMVFLHNHFKMQMRDGSAMLQELLRIKNPSLTEGRCLRQHLRGALLALVDSLVLSIFAWNDSHFIRCLQCSHIGGLVLWADSPLL